jgi:hypothetical protein
MVPQGGEQTMSAGTADGAAVGGGAGWRILDGFDRPPPGRFAGALAPGLGLSYTYRGLAPEDALARLDVREDAPGTDDAGRPQRRLVLADRETGLRLQLTYTDYPRDRAVLFGGELVHAGDRPLEHVTDLRSLDLAFDLTATGIGAPRIHTIGGGVTHYFYPPLAYQLDCRTLLGPVTMPALRIDSGGTGRSSDRHLPYFYVEDAAQDSGLFCALEWSGLWGIEFQRNEPVRRGRRPAPGGRPVLRIRGGMEEVDLTLRAGERLPIPRVLLGFYEGPLDAGRNTLRRFLWETWAPLHDGQKPLPPVLYNQHGAFGVDFDDAFMRTQVDAAARIGIEYFEIDAGWYAGAPEVFSTGVGNWEREDRGRFPQGVKAFADYVRSRGLQYGTWFDIERCHRDSDVAREHPEWCLATEASDRQLQRPAGRDYLLVDFGRRDVREWAIELIDRRIREWGVRWMRYDNNIGPAPYWRAAEVDGERGRRQIGHIEGAWWLLERIVRDNPSLILETCSSGGRRFDLATFARAHSGWMSDHNQHHDIVRNQHSGALTVIPGIYLNSRIVYRGRHYPDVFYHAHFGGALMFSEDLASWSDAELETARRHVAVYKSVRHLLNKDFYPLFPQPRDLDTWDGWQFDDPATGEGFLLAFRLSRAPDGSRRLRLRGLLPDARYTVSDPYDPQGNTTWTLRGRELMDDGFPASLEPDSSRLLRYRAST